MKLLFSENKPDYAHYIFSYAIWAIPEPGDQPADLFNLGFLPSSRNLDRFYLCRSVRVDLARYRTSSENRRILRKGEGIHVRLIPRVEFEYSNERRNFYKEYAEARFGKDVMTWERLDSLFATKITSHILLFTNAQTGAELGAVTLYLEGRDLAFYYYAFYDLNHLNRNLGMFMMTSAVEWLAREQYRHLYLGSCYSRSALYKTQFSGIEFFNGFRWSGDIDELKFLIERDQKDTGEHLLEAEDYRQLFCDGGLHLPAGATPFRAEAPTKASHQPN
jgi:arginyl-tRNA--protein-N-Asp/Glu arginylyltransferase